MELTAVICLAAVGIFFAGPTLIREINAHFKLWDDSIQDSYTDPMIQPDPEPIPTGCVCSDPIGSPGERCGVSPCKANERLTTRLCNPAGCGKAAGWQVEACVTDDSCCDIFHDYAECGTGAVDANGKGCPLGQRLTQANCGAGKVKWGCRPDSDEIPKDGNPSCVPKCMAPYTSSFDSSKPYLPIICSGDDKNFPINSPWMQNATGIGLPLVMVGGIENCSSPDGSVPKCEAYCPNGYMKQGLSCLPKCSTVDYLVYADGDMYTWLFGPLDGTIPVMNRCPSGGNNWRRLCTIENLQSGSATPWLAQGKTEDTIDPNFAGLKKPIPIQTNDVVTVYANSQSCISAFFRTTGDDNFDCAAAMPSCKKPTSGTFAYAISNSKNDLDLSHNGSLTIPNDGYLVICGGPDDNVAAVVSRPTPCGCRYSRRCVNGVNVSDGTWRAFCDDGDVRQACRYSCTGKCENSGVNDVAPNGCDAWEGPNDYGAHDCRLDCLHGGAIASTITYDSVPICPIGCNFSGSTRYKSSSGPDMYIYCKDNAFMDICQSDDGNHSYGLETGNKCKNAKNGLFNIIGEDSDGGWPVTISRAGGKLVSATFSGGAYGTKSYVIQPSSFGGFDCIANPRSPDGKYHYWSYIDNKAGNDIRFWCQDGSFQKLETIDPD